MRIPVFVIYFCVWLSMGGQAFALEPVVSEELPEQVAPHPRALQTDDDIATEAAAVCDAHVAQAAAQKKSILREGAGPVPSADYKAGVDAYGRAVPSADAGGAHAVELPDRITFPVTVDVAKNMGISLPKGLEMQGRLGEITVLRGGQVLYNGREITDKIVTFCQQPKHPKDQSHDASRAKTK